MSFYDQASLVMIPSGVKTGTVFSQKPLSTDGELTFTRNSNATRVNADGLVENVRTNYSLYSEDQTQWSFQNETSVTYDAAANPLNGAVTADKVIPSTLTADHYRGFTMATLNGEVTASIYVKADGYSVIDWGIYNNTATAYLVRAAFDLSTQSISFYAGSIASITSIGSGWYRISVTGTLSSSGSLGLYHRVRPTVGFTNYAGNGTSGALFWGCQLENGVMTDYIGATTTAAVSVGPTANVPRLDYSGGACPSLLLEPQRTNINTYSENFSDSSYGLTNATVSTNAAISPDGYQNADSLIDNSTSGNHRFIKGISGATIGQNYTYSIWLKKGTMNSAYLNLFSGGTIANAQVDLVNGTITSGGAGTNHTIEAYANDWYRCSITGTAGDTNIYIYCYLKQLSGYVGNGDNVYLWGAQVEAGSYATSYIPTLGASVTRLADAAYKTGISSLIGQTEGTIFWEGNIKAVSELSRLIYISDGTISNFINTYIDATNKIAATVRVSASTVTSFESTAQTAGTIKVAFAYKANDCALYVNGVSISGTSGATVPSTSRLDIGSRLGTDSFFNSGASQALLFKTRLTNAQLAELTTL